MCTYIPQYFVLNPQSVLPSYKEQGVSTNFGCKVPNYYQNSLKLSWRRWNYIRKAYSPWCRYPDRPPLIRILRWSVAMATECLKKLKLYVISSSKILLNRNAIQLLWQQIWIKDDSASSFLGQCYSLPKSIFKNSTKIVHKHSHSQPKPNKNHPIIYCIKYSKSNWSPGRKSKRKILSIVGK